MMLLASTPLHELHLPPPEHEPTHARVLPMELRHDMVRVAICGGITLLQQWYERYTIDRQRIVFRTAHKLWWGLHSRKVQKGGHEINERDQGVDIAHMIDPWS
jgi:hypothetical protein